MDEQAPTGDPVVDEPIVCPNCGESLTVEFDGQNYLVQCPFCEAAISLGAPDEEARLASASDQTTEADSELDGLRIRQLVKSRRSAIRARTYAVIIMICCLVMGVQLIFTDIQEVHSYGWDIWAILYAISAAAMAVGATMASRKAAGLHRESLISLATEFEEAPEFEALSDGSHRIANLEMMQDSNDESS